MVLASRLTADSVLKAKTKHLQHQIGSSQLNNNIYETNEQSESRAKMQNATLWTTILKSCARNSRRSNAYYCDSLLFMTVISSWVRMGEAV